MTALGLGAAFLLYAICSWIHEMILTARMRKGLKYIEIGITKYYEDLYKEYNEDYLGKRPRKEL